MIQLGYQPDPYDARDLPFAAVKDSLPLASSSEEPFVIPIARPARDQTGQSCVANAWVRALELLSDLAGAPLPELSAQHLYWCSRQQHGAEQVDGGTMLRTAADALKTFGVCPAEDWPDDRSTINDQPAPGAFVDAHDARISAYYRIFERGTLGGHEVEQAVRALHPVVIGVPVGHDFITYGGGGHIFEPPSSVVGRHAMLVVGVAGFGSSRRWRLLNSWGPWGEDGLVWISSSYLDTAIDIWVATAATAAP